LKKVSCDACPNTSCLIKKNFVPEWSEFIEREKYQAVYKKDYSIFSVGNPILGLFFVQSGMIKEFILRPHSEVEIVRFANEGKVFGHAGFDNNFYSFGADAKVDSVVCFYNNEILKVMYATNPKLLYDLMTFYSNEHSESTYRLMSISQMNLREKVASVLYYLYKSFGLNETKELQECFNRDDIANLACTTTEQVSRQLSDFQKEKIIEKRARKIAILKPAELKNIINDYLILFKTTE
jgi:CRP/FNR family transcriptional regulator, anaerobic regulatory protein